MTFSDNQIRSLEAQLDLANRQLKGKGEKDDRRKTMSASMMLPPATKVKKETTFGPSRRHYNTNLFGFVLYVIELSSSFM